ncbi:sugar phosphate isomerase/epimerase [Leucobacter sp. wl10]|uniref:sugar phosphate isomerase/epimerase family protein n=1 Tax=Leucobacter sp. wl10 TaxID=2304677 RepID=UPI000E5B2864|nr:TIM barrel protein [Leucobacter sp. wl10]RGE21955.1 AP endonuclease [Leucobacter sp. wl10]
MLSLVQVSGSNFSYQHRPLDECFDDLAALGRTAVELWGIAPQLHVPWLSDAEARAVRRGAAARGLEIVCFTPEQVIYPVNIASPDSRLRAASIAMFKRAAELAVELGAPRLFLTPGRGFEGEPVDAARRRAIDALGEICGYAGRLGLECLLEPLQRVESNLVNSAADAARALADVAAPNLGVALDTVAMAVAGDTVDGCFAALGDRVRHVHLVDGAPAGHLAWGDGELPLAEILRALDRNGYEGWMTVELFGDGGYALDPRPALERSYAAIEAALSAG